MEPHVAIVGAGIAGLACAEQLAHNNIKVTLFDKGKRPGGRLASVAIDGLAWDIGAPCLVATHHSFVDQTKIWLREGWIKPWPEGPAGALVGAPSMASLVAAQSARFETHFGWLVERSERDASGWHIAHGDVREGPFSGLVIAVPAEQAAALVSLQDLELARVAAAVRSAPCWTAMLAFAEPLGRDPIYFDRGPIKTAIRGRSAQNAEAECWVLHATAEWSEANLELERDVVAAQLAQSFADNLGIALPEPIFLKAHRWRFALPSGTTTRFGWNPTLQLGVCGDWWIAPTVEGAWLSGNALGRQMAQMGEGAPQGLFARQR